jgi:FMN phosphatase YigB (HAD superfamily)
MNLDELKVVTWDVDGTLYSLRRMKRFVLAKYLKETLKGRGVLAHQQLTTLRQYREVINRVRTNGGALDESVLGTLDSGLLTAATQRWYVEAIAKTGPRSDVEKVLISFRSRGIPQVVFSDYEAESKLKALRLAEYFDGVYVGERLGFVKPHTAVLKRIAVDFSVPLESVLHIGDRIDRDEAAARAAGCRCLILGRDFRSFKWLLKHLLS